MEHKYLFHKNGKNLKEKSNVILGMIAIEAISIQTNWG